MHVLFRIRILRRVAEIAVVLFRIGAEVRVFVRTRKRETSPRRFRPANHVLAHSPMVHAFPVKQAFLPTNPERVRNQLELITTKTAQNRRHHGFVLHRVQTARAVQQHAPRFHQSQRVRRNRNLRRVQRVAEPGVPPLQNIRILAKRAVARTRDVGENGVVSFCLFGFFRGAAAAAPFAFAGVRNHRLPKHGHRYVLSHRARHHQRSCFVNVPFVPLERLAQGIHASRVPVVRHDEAGPLRFRRAVVCTRRGFGGPRTAPLAAKTHRAHQLQKLHGFVSRCRAHVKHAVAWFQYTRKRKHGEHGDGFLPRAHPVCHADGHGVCDERVQFSVVPCLRLVRHRVQAPPPFAWWHPRNRSYQAFFL
mmetsp:Transcript_5313/g.19909  ORF Transcript_5313/g.19909 Transcript_5313/m.19909 type:complete len:363 (-) Transcript_5313:407-1495(-)